LLCGIPAGSQDLTPQVFDRRYDQQQALGGFLRSFAAREGER
jgi:hypothetical protein